jgi:hypothetical protein
VSPEAPNTDAVLRHRDDVAAVEVDGETVIYDPDAALLHHLDATATAVWHLIDGATTLGAIADALAARYAADLDVVRADVVRLARQLRDDRLVETMGP